MSTLFYGVYLFKQKDGLQKAGLALMAGGFVFHTLFILTECVSIGYLPVYNLRLTLSMAAWSSAAVYFWIRYRYRIKVMGIYAAPLVACVYIISLNFPEIPAHAAELFKSVWLVVHVITVFIGEASLAMACGAGILYLIQEHGIKSKKRGFFYSRLPSLEQLDATGYAGIVIGFTAFTVGLIVGLVYAKLVWHRFASWDPKEIWSGISWLVYAALLHERIAVGWRGRRAAIMAIIGFVVLMFSFLGVTFLMGGHHGGFTQWQIPYKP
ncbi:MAG: cytochrome c biogenesis protein [Proteobacteria bacterium]|nr:cytochrome c biogenesis protein [Pseudomonadota bacterium]